eukprot:jgi/Undpi1/2922/HiC_scaffold_14.g06299.m1
MAQASISLIPHLGERSSAVDKLTREESGRGGDVDDGAPRHSGGRTTAKQNRKAAISMLPNPDPAKVQSCAACKMGIAGQCFIRCEECRARQVDPREVDLCINCFYQGKEVFEHKKTHAYRVMDKLETPVYTEDWTAAEELALADHTRRKGIAAWEEAADLKRMRKKTKTKSKTGSKTTLKECNLTPPPAPAPPPPQEPFFKRRSPAELEAHYFDVYLARHGSVLPTHYLQRREHGGVEEVPIPLTSPQSCEPHLRGVKVQNSAEFRSRTIAELGTNPNFQAKAAAATVTATAADTDAATVTGAASAAATATVGGASTACANGTAGAAANTARVAGGRGASRAASGSASGSRKANGTAYGNSNGNSKKRKVAKAKNKQEEAAIRAWVEQLPGAGLPGYHPLRGEFEEEHDNSAEELLADMVCSPDDDKAEKQLKRDVMSVFDRRLDEREKRKKFIIEHNLTGLDEKPQKKKAASKKRPKEQREVLAAELRPLARFSTAEEHEELIDDLLTTKKLRAEIEQLKSLKNKGVSTVAGGVNLHEKQQEMVGVVGRWGGGLSLSSVLSFISVLYPPHFSLGGGGCTHITPDRNPSDYNPSHTYNAGTKHGPAGGACERPSENLLDLTGAPGLEYLSEAEILLCSQLHIIPPYYLGMKTAILQECVRTGSLTKQNASSVVQMDRARLDQDIRATYLESEFEKRVFATVKRVYGQD